MVFQFVRLGFTRYEEHYLEFVQIPEVYKMSTKYYILQCDKTDLLTTDIVDSTLRKQKET